VQVEEKKAEEQVPTTIVQTKNIVLADGTYASVTTTETVGGAAADDAVPHLRKLVSGGDILLGTVAGVCLTKMALKATKVRALLQLHFPSPICRSSPPVSLRVHGYVFVRTRTRWWPGCS
jgi:hypothetical protein